MCDSAINKQTNKKMNDRSNEYKTPLGLTSQFSFCGLPLRLDTYAGCALSCTYCFARLRGGNANTNKIRYADPKLIITKFKNAIEQTERTTGLVAELIRNKTPLHFGGMSDPFQPIEKRENISLKVLKYLCSISYPIVISTKSTLLSDSEYLNVLKSNKNIVVQFSFSTLDDNISKIVEPFSFSPSEILKCATKLSESGVKTSIRWQPYIPYVSEAPTDFISQISETGITHLGFEHLKLPIEKNNPLWKKLTTKLSFDIREFYLQHNARTDGREFILQPEYKIKTALLIKAELKKRNITFGSADNDIQYLSDNNCCCSGVDQFEGFENWNKYQIAFAVKKSRGEQITFDLIANEWTPKGAIDKYLNSDSRMVRQNGHNTVADYVKARWENLNSDFNPSKFYGVRDSGLRDNNGYRIFDWDLKIKQLIQCL